MLNTDILLAIIKNITARHWKAVKLPVQKPACTKSQNNYYYNINLVFIYLQ